MHPTLLFVKFEQMEDAQISAYHISLFALYFPKAASGLMNCTVPRVGVRVCVIHGFVTNLLNPKSAIFALPISSINIFEPIFYGKIEVCCRACLLLIFLWIIPQP